MPGKKKHEPLNNIDFIKMKKRFAASWVILALKYCTDEKHAKSSLEITQLITQVIGNGNDIDMGFKQTVDRKLNDFVEIEMNYNNPENPERAKISEKAYQVFGGRVRSVQSEGKDPEKYYFEPVLDNGDVSMILASLRSNHYLSHEETGYLSDSITAAIGYSETDRKSLPSEEESAERQLEILLEKLSEKLPEKPQSPEKSGLPIHSSVTLKKINTIHEAITGGYRLSMNYGTYYPMGKRIKFVEKDPDKEFTVDPYAMVSQNGQLYLIGNFPGNKDICIIRIDRIFRLDILKNEDGKEVKIAEIPPTLKRYFDKKGRFDSSAFTSKHPVMAYPHKEIGETYCEFTCGDSKLPLVVDYFGPEIETESSLEDESVKVRVRADFNNVLFFCNQFSYLGITPLSPPNLVEEVRKQLTEAIKRLP